jgi:formate hydrogenlyase subunit 3/multisubunit Na+/H+ antiporter MnhD subunit
MGVLLLSNASIPPFPSFFPELSLVHSLLVNTGIISGLFVILSLVVCYFNAFIFICVSHKSRNEVVSGPFKLQERVKLFFLVILTMLSLV